MRNTLIAIICLLLATGSSYAQSVDTVIRIINGGSQDDFRFRITDVGGGAVQVQVGVPSANMERVETVAPGATQDVRISRDIFDIRGSVTNDRTNNVLTFSGDLVIRGVGQVQFYGSPIAVLP